MGTRGVRMKIGQREFDFTKKTYVMGILNITPDSFSDGGKWNRLDQALFRARQMEEEGAAVLDIGAESTRPGYTPISAEEEIERLMPVIEKVKANISLPISVDTYKSKVAKAALCAGADMVNDIWGFRYDAEMAKAAANAGAACCLTHNRKKAEYQDFFQELAADLRESVQIAKNAGVSDDAILLDPGIGFGKTYEQNLEALRNLGQLKKIGYPLLLGASRKSVVGLTLNLPVSKRLEGTLVTTVFAVMSQCAFVRVHDVKENVRAIKMAEAILYKA